MALQIQDKIVQTFPEPNIAAVYGTYPTIAIANIAVEAANVKCAGLTVGIKDATTGVVTEYWYQPNQSNVLELVEKQSASVVVDTTPTEGSNNPVSSGGVYTELERKANTSDIPAISTNIEADATSETKAAAPKAVKTYVDSKVSSAYKAAGSVANVASLPALIASNIGKVCNMTSEFTTTSDFVEGSGKTYPAGTNVAVVEHTTGVYKYDVFAGFVDLSGKADKSEMSVTDGAGANADKTTIQLKNGTSATVLKQHQSLAGYVQRSGNYIENNFASFDSNGGIKDSGCNEGSFATAAQGAKADTALQQVTVGTTTTGAAGSNANVTISGTSSSPVLNFTIPRGADGQNGADAVNPFKGMFITTSDANIPLSGQAGDYIFIADANPATTIDLYYWNTAKTPYAGWDDTGYDINPGSLAEFAGGTAVSMVHIINDFTTGGSTNVASAETVKTLKHNVDEIGRVIDPNSPYNLFVKTETQIADSRIDGSGNVVSQNGATVSYKIPIIAGETYARYYSSGAASNCYVRFLDAYDNKLKPLNPSDDSEMAYNATGINGVFKAPATAVYLQFCINYGANGDINSAVVIKASSLPSPLAYVDGPYAKVAPSAIGTAQLANSAVNGEKIADNSIPAGKLLSGAVIGGNIAANVVGETNMVNGSITQSKLSDSIKNFKAGNYDKSAFVKELFLDIAGLSVTSCSFQCSVLGNAALFISGDGYQIRSILYPTENNVLYSLKVDYSEHQSFSIGDIIGYVVFSDYSSFVGTLDGSSAKNNVNVGFTSVVTNFPIISSYTLRGKSIIFTGDSICQATTDFQNGGGWAKRIGEKNGMKWENKGISGGTIIDKDLVNSTFTISETDFGTGADYIILEGGVNDADKIGSILNNNIPSLFGSFSWTDYQSIFTNDTFCGAVEKLIKGVVTSYPDAKVGFIIPMKMGVNFVDGYQKESNNRRAYFETIIEICRKWGVPVLNLWDNCTMNPDIASHYTSGDGHLYVDGIHPTGYGYDFLAPIIESWIKSL